MTKRTKTGTRISTAALIAATLLAIGFGATALYAASYAPGYVHEELQCLKYGGRLAPERIVCEAIVHRFARRDALVRYVETSGSQNGYQLGKDLVLFSRPAGLCKEFQKETR